jgi:iron complex transport system ATP-binding protein
MRLSVEALTVSYGSRPVLRGVDMAVAAGTVAAVIGPNGAGKSSLLRAVMGLIPSGGRVRVDGTDLRSMRREKVADRLSYLPQDNAVRSALSVLDVVLLGRVAKLGWHLPFNEVERAIHALERLGLAHLASRPIGEVSGGQRQLVFLAQALIRNPVLLLLDEPTSALDLRHQLIVLTTLRSIAAGNGPAIMVVMHDLNLAARFSDQLIVLHRGQLHSQGPPAAVLTTGMLADVFEVEADMASSVRSSSIVVPIRAVPMSHPP